MRRRRLVAVGLVLGALACAASCREPTQVLVEARTNVEYRAGLVTSFTVGAPGETENAESTTETAEAWGPDGLVGSLTVVPRSADDAPLSVKLVLGLRRAARECVPPAYEGCVVARRRLRYVPNRLLRLPITLYVQCENVPCDADTTCNALGRCVSADVDPETCDQPGGCTIRLPPGPTPRRTDLACRPTAPRTTEASPTRRPTRTEAGAAATAATEDRRARSRAAA